MDDFPDVPDEILDSTGPTVAPAFLLEEWTRATFIEDGPLHNPDHEHLRHARLGILWTSVEYVRKGQRVAGEAREGQPSGANAWTKARQRQQLRRWFGEEWGGALPDFLITIDALWVQERLEEGNYYAVCALIEHELYHCAQATDRNGMPAFDDRTGRPKWTIAPHDIEEFTGVAERYGGATEALQRTQAALKRGPTVEAADVETACGCGASL